MNKSVKKIIFVLFLMFGCIFFGFTPKYVEGATIFTDHSIMTAKVPDELLQLVKSRLPYFDSIMNTDEKIPLGNKSLGTPFSVYDDDEQTTYYYFPLYHQDKLIKTVFCYYGNGHWGTDVSNYLVPQLSTYNNKANSQKELAFVQKNGDMYLVDEKDHIQLFHHSPMSRECLDPRHVKLSTFNRKNLFLEKINNNYYTMPVMNREIDNTPSTVTKAEGQKYLNLDFLEYQQDNNWCAAYATTAIIRYATKSKTPTAKQMMEYYYPNDKDLNNKSVNWDQCIEYGYKNGFFDMNGLLNPISVEGTQFEINDNFPFYIAATITQIKDKTHALVVRGYANFSFYKTISVWNPWSKASDGYDLLDPDTHMIVSHGKTLKNYGGIYGWHHGSMVTK